MISRYQSDRDAYVCDHTQRRLEREGLRLCVGRNTAYRPGKRSSGQILADIVFDAVQAVLRAAKGIDDALFGDDQPSRLTTYLCAALCAAIVALLLGNGILHALAR